MTYPATPNEHSMRKDIDLTQMSPTLMASTFRRNSRPPRNPTPVSSDSAENSTYIGSSHPDFIDQPFWSHGFKPNSSITDCDIYTHIEANSKTPTRNSQGINLDSFWSFPSPININDRLPSS